MSSLLNKTALVTGASRGIGKAIALKLASEGAYVLVHYATNDQAAHETLARIKANGGNGTLFKCKFENLHNIDVLVDQVDNHLNGNKVDILINNAGILHRIDMENITEEHFDALFSVNVKAPFFLTRQLVKRMNDGGRIINISSYLSKRAKYEYTAYSMTKAALDNFTTSLAIALGPRKITVNTVAPGSVDTDMNKDRFSDLKVRQAVSEKTAFQRVGKADDIAKTIMLLVSEDGGWITGQYIEASGGLGLVR
jgi:NAD(P)-dependent dehydrogenase (short-subunit alcohol dehydrogenase family)